MAGEGAQIDDAALLKALEASYEQTADNRSYYKQLDRLFREYHLLQLEKQPKYYEVPITVNVLEKV